MQYINLVDIVINMCYTYNNSITNKNTETACIMLCLTLKLRYRLTETTNLLDIEVCLQIENYLVNTLTINE